MNKDHFDEFFDSVFTIFSSCKNLFRFIERKMQIYKIMILFSLIFDMEMKILKIFFWEVHSFFILTYHHDWYIFFKTKR